MGGPQFGGNAKGYTIYVEHGDLVHSEASDRELRIKPATDGVRVGCTYITRKAWRLLKEKIEKALES